MGLRNVGLAAGLVSLVVGLAAQAADEVPAPFAPFEYLVGSWKGQGALTSNRVRGWPETHAWAWKFEKGTPVGMTVTMTGDKSLARGQLAYDPATKRYTLAGTDPAGKPVAFSGALDKAGNTLTLDRDGATPAGSKQRLTLFPNANFIRYTARVSEQEPGAPQFKPAIEVGLTKEGESFAAGGSAADLPKCIVTGGAATMNVTYQGKTFPLCCTGCRDEFNDNPEKYIKKLSLRTEAAARGGSKPAAATNKDDGSFDGLVDDPRPKPKPAGPMKKDDGEAKKTRPAADAPKSSTSDATKAASLLRLGQALEKDGKTAPALGYYRRILKEYPDTPAARTASARAKALDTP